MKSPTNDQFHYLIGKSIFLEIFNDKYQNICLINDYGKYYGLGCLMS